MNPVTAHRTSPHREPRHAREARARHRRRLLMSGLFVVASTGAVAVNLPPPGLPEDAVRLEVEVDGLSCAFWCPVGVDAVLRDLPALEIRSVDTVDGRIVIDHDPKQVSADTILHRLGERWHLLRAWTAEGTGPLRDVPLPSTGSATRAPAPVAR